MVVVAVLLLMFAVALTMQLQKLHGSFAIRHCHSSLPPLVADGLLAPLPMGQIPSLKWTAWPESTRRTECLLPHDSFCSILLESYEKPYEGASIGWETFQNPSCKTMNAENLVSRDVRHPVKQLLLFSPKFSRAAALSSHAEKAKRESFWKCDSQEHQESLQLCFECVLFESQTCWQHIGTLLMPRANTWHR